MLIMSFIIGSGKAFAQCTTLPAGLDLHLKLDETGNVSTAADSAGTNTGTLTNFPADPTANWVTGQIGGGLDFDGGDDFINLTATAGGVLNGVRAVTGAAWIQLDTTQNQDIISISKGGGATQSSRFVIEIATTDELRVGGRASDADSYRSVATTTRAFKPEAATYLVAV